MKLGMIGLGRMGSNMTQRFLNSGHEVVGYARHVEDVKKVVDLGAEGADSIENLVSKLPPRRVIWVMIPAGDPVDRTLNHLRTFLQADDIIIEGGNSFYKDTMRRAQSLEKKGIILIDTGTSGGIWGLSEGYSLMIGGDKDAIEFLAPLFEALAPGKNKGWGHVGPSGSGHFVKMVHNGIEYGLMQAYAEGFALMDRKKEFNLDLQKIAEIWRYGSVVRSWLLDLTAWALKENPFLEGIAPYVADSGEGRWTVQEAIEQDLQLPVITMSLLQRFKSREENNYTDKLLAVLRDKFGGHGLKGTGNNEKNLG